MSPEPETQPRGTIAGISVCPDVPCPRRMDALRRVLSRAEDRATLIDDPDRTPDETDILIVLMPPVDAIAHDLQEGQEVETAVARWYGRVARLVALHRRNRHRSRVLADTDFLKQSARWIGHDLSQVSDDNASQDLLVPMPFYQLLASHALHDDMQARELAEEVEACASSDDFAQPAIDLEALRSEFGTMAAEKARLRRERDAEYEEKTVVQRELTAAQARLMKTEEKLARLYASTSFRITKPIRIIAAKFRRKT